MKCEEGKSCKKGWVERKKRDKERESVECGEKSWEWEKVKERE